MSATCIQAISASLDFPKAARASQYMRLSRRLYKTAIPPLEPIRLVANKKRVFVSTKDRGSKIRVNLSRSDWATEEIRNLLRLAINHRNANKSISWVDVVRSVSGCSSSACSNQYNVILNHYRKYISGNGLPDYYKSIVVELKGLLRKCCRLDESHRQMRAEWTLKDDQRLLELLSLDKTWEQVAYSMGKFTGQQCIRRKYSLIYRQKRLDKQQAILANSEQPPVTGALPDGTVVTLGKIEFSNIQKKNTIAKHTKTWSRVDDDKLYDLVTQQREFDYNYLKSYFPGTSISQMYQALQRISSARFEDHGYKMWTREEEEILLRLVQKHGAKWKKIAEEMPTERRPMQCLMFYRYAINGVERRRDIWTKKETLRLETLVELFMQGKLLPLSEQKGLISNPQSSKPPTVLFPDKLASVEQLERILCYLKRQRLCEKLSADSGSMQNKRINWNLIAPYMAPKTKTQCNIGWHNLQEARRKATNPSCEEPWTREEDLGLYTLYAQAPKQWSWIIKHLPRYRYRHSVKYRYNNHIKYYIDLLRKRKKPSWDPTDDQFEEVHRLCEIKAWRARRLTGYRIKDGYIPPADLNLNGDSYCF